MWNFFQRRRLVEKGMACSKTRRTVSDSEFSEALESGWSVRVVILAAFVCGLALLIFSGQQDEPAKKFLLCLLIFCTAVTQLWINHPLTLGGNATNGSDYQAVARFVEIPAGQRSLRVTIRPQDDDLPEQTERARISLKSTVDFTVKSGAASAFVTISDDDGGVPAKAVPSVRADGSA